MDSHAVDEIVRQLRFTSGVLVAPGIPKKKLQNAMARNGFIGNAPVLGLIDCTAFGSGKDNVMFTTQGIFWHHPSSKPSSGQITYQEFASCSFSSAGLFSGVQSGRGHTISVAASGISKSNFITLLNNIRNITAPFYTSQHSQILNHQGQVPSPQQPSKADLLSLAHNMTEAKNWDEAIRAYEQADEFRMAGLVREKKAEWEKQHR